MDKETKDFLREIAAQLAAVGRAVLAVILTMGLVAWEPWPGPSTPPPGGPAPYPAPCPAPYPSQEDQR